MSITHGRKEEVHAVLFFIFTFVLFVTPRITQAESTVWSHFTPGVLFYQYDAWPTSCIGTAKDTQVNVRYEVHARRVDTGESVCGGTVPQGTQVRFEFEPRTYRDIEWFTTGFNHDSPYGAWAAGAAMPPAAALNEWCSANNYAYTFGSRGDSGYTPSNEAHIALQVNPPQQTVTGTTPFSCGTPDASGSVTCTADTTGDATATFNFSQTYGRFYFAILWDPRIWGYNCSAYTNGALRHTEVTSYYYGLPVNSTCTEANRYDLAVPAQSISCPITVVSGDSTGTTGGNGGKNPTSPTISSARASCTVGTLYTISFSSTDPTGDKIRYGIDWNANGTVDQFFPATGFVSSGTAGTAGRTYSSDGEKKVRVMTIDEHGFTSGWSHLTFGCLQASNSAATGSNTSSTGNNSSHSGYSTASPSLSIKAIPSLVRSGDTTKLQWSASNVDSCAVEGTNGDGVHAEATSVWRTVASPASGVPSSPIRSQTVYTLQCTDQDENTISARATVNVLPSWSEQ